MDEGSILDLSLSLSLEPAVMEEIEAIANIPPVEEEVEEQSEEVAKKPPKPHKKTLDPIPRPKSEVFVYDGKTKRPVTINFQGGDLKRGGDYQPNRRLRQDSRTRYQYALQRKAYKMKLVTDDDVLVVTRSREKEIRENKPYLFSWTTDVDNLSYTREESCSSASGSSSSTITTHVQEEQENLLPVLNFIELARKSPSKPRGHSTSRGIKALTDKICAKCHIAWDSPEDKKLASPGIGCDGYTTNNQECPYWVHTCCVGFSNARPNDFASIPFYCPEHNPTVPIICSLKEAVKKRRKPSTSERRQKDKKRKTKK